MKNKILLLALLPLLLTGCGEDKPNPQEFVERVSKTASIAVRRYNKRTEALIGSDPTYVYKPSTFNRKEHPDWPVIYATNFALDTWFEYEGNTNYRADITWTFTRPELIVYRLPTSDVISRATMTFKDSAFPETVGEEVKCALVGTVTFEGAVATASYEIIFKTLPEGEGI